MRQQRPLILTALVLLALLFSTGESSAQTGYRYSVGLMAGFGSPTGSEPSSAAGVEPFLRDDRFELGYQLVFSMETARKTLFNVRFGQVDVEIEDSSPFTPVTESELTYLTLAGEYRLPSGFYDSGLFLGVGYYEVAGKNQVPDDSGLGLNLGATGDFRINDRWSVLVELSGHYADLEYAQFFLMGHAGLAFRF